MYHLRPCLQSLTTTHHLDPKSEPVSPRSQVGGLVNDMTEKSPLTPFYSNRERPPDTVVVLLGTQTPTTSRQSFITSFLHTSRPSHSCPDSPRDPPNFCDCDSFSSVFSESGSSQTPTGTPHQKEELTVLGHTICHKGGLRSCHSDSMKDETRRGSCHLTDPGYPRPVEEVSQTQGSWRPVKEVSQSCNSRTCEGGYDSPTGTHI